MKKRYLLITLFAIVSCSTSKNFNETIEIKTLKRPSFEVKYMNNWFIGKVKGKDTISAVVISKWNRSFSPSLIVESDWSSASYFYSIIALSDIGTDSGIVGEDIDAGGYVGAGPDTPRNPVDGRHRGGERDFPGPGLCPG